MITSAFMLSAASSGKMFVPCLFKAALLLSAAFSVTGMYRKNTLLLLFFAAHWQLPHSFVPHPAKRRLPPNLYAALKVFT